MPCDVTITRLPLRALFDLKGEEEALRHWRLHGMPPAPDGPNRMTQEDGRQLVHSGPGHWLLMAPLKEEEALTAMLCANDARYNLSVVLVSDALTFFAVTGADAAEVMAVATPIDLHTRAFAEDGVTWTEAFGAKALVRRIDDGFEIAVDRSYADWFQDALVRAAA